MRRAKRVLFLAWRGGAQGVAREHSDRGPAERREAAPRHARLVVFLRIWMHEERRPGGRLASTTRMESTGSDAGERLPAMGSAVAE